MTDKNEQTCYAEAEKYAKEQAANVPDVMRLKGTELNPMQADIVQMFKREGNELADKLDRLLPAGRDRSLAITHLEDCIMRAVRAATAPIDKSGKSASAHQHSHAHNIG